MIPRSSTSCARKGTDRPCDELNCAVRTTGAGIGFGPGIEKDCDDVKVGPRVLTRSVSHIKAWSLLLYASGYSKHVALQYQKTELRCIIRQEDT